MKASSAAPRRAAYYENLNEGKVRCVLCPHHCRIPPGGLGACRARMNIEGELYSMNYGRVTSVSLDPIEKKPLNRFHPGSFILSAGTFGCNLKCSFCQNWTISQEEARTADVMPENLVEKALELRAHGNIGIAYTYNEPSIWYEFVRDTAALARENKLVNVLVTNGYIEEKPLQELLPYIDAMNIDGKAFSDRFYKELCKGTLNEVKRTVELAAPRCHVEITTLVIPGENDAASEVEEIAKWLASISPGIPLHLSRFFPNYRMIDREPTPVETLIKARDAAAAHLHHVFLGNVH